MPEVVSFSDTNNYIFPIPESFVNNNFVQASFAKTTFPSLSILFNIEKFPYPSFVVILRCYWLSNII